MPISAAGLDLIKSFEGYHRKLPSGDCVAYRCPAGVWTLGWGCTVGIREGMVWTPQQAEDALRREIAKFEAAVTRLVTVEINQNQYDALVSFAYNCGEGALAKSTILRRTNAGDFDGAAKAFAMWNKGGGRVLPGLVRRRAEEAALFLRPVAPSAEPDMPQAVATEEPAPGLAHPKIHLELKQESFWYRAKHRILKTLGIGVPAGASGASLLDDPLTTFGQIAGVVRAHSLVIVGVALVAVVAFEAVQYRDRTNHMEPGQ